MMRVTSPKGVKMFFLSPFREMGMVPEMMAVFLISRLLGESYLPIAQGRGDVKDTDLNLTFSSSAGKNEKKKCFREEQMGDMVSTITDEQFEEVITKAEKPVLVDFWAPWCGPCRALAPSVEGLAKDHAEHLNVYKLNVDENPRTAAKFGVRSIPTLILFNKGEVVDKMVGLMPREQLEAFVKKVLPAG